MARTIKDSIARRIADMKAIRGLERKAHFEAGGTLDGWLGRSWVNTDRRKAADKKACRGPVEDC